MPPPKLVGQVPPRRSRAAARFRLSQPPVGQASSVALDHPRYSRLEHTFDSVKVFRPFQAAAARSQPLLRSHASKVVSPG